MLKDPMKTLLRSTQIKIFFFIILFVAISQISSNSFQEKGPHGGTIKKAGNYFIEMTNPDKFFYAYLLDKDSHTLSNKGISGDVKFFLPDSSIFEVQLKPSGDNAFSGEGFPGFYSCKISFNVFGNSVSAKFENQTLIARRKK
jgi:hypothetical protein